MADFAILAGEWGESEGTGSVRVNISGTVPTGGQWRVDSVGPWYNSGDTASGISVGAHTITFADVAGYAKPADEPVNIPYGGSTTIETFVTMSSSVWKYLYNGSDQGTAWRAYGFNDSSWGSGPSQLGFSNSGGEGDENTLIGPKVDGRRTAYFRHKFNVSNVSQITALEIDLLYDDGTVVYINDQEVNRVHMPTGTIAYNTLANVQGENSTVTFSGISLSMLNEGNNILAVDVHQNTDTSSDISFDLNLEATRVIAGSGPAVVNAGPYIQQTGTLVVNISPQGAIDDGAQWRVDGGLWHDSGSEVTQAVGTHTVEFSSIPGWQRPGSVQVQVFNGAQAVVNRTYCPAQSTGLQITEFMADNDSRSPLVPGNILDGDLMSSDWVEIYNNSGSPADISGTYLTDEADEKTKWQFPAGMPQLQPGAYLIVFASGKTQELNPGNYPYWDGTYYHTNFELDKDGEYLALIDADGTTPIHEYVKYPDQEENFSYGLFNSDMSYFSQATPGAANMGEFVAFVEKPDVSFNGGCYQTALDVTLSCGTVGADIYYTTDRTDPTPTNGTLYTGPIRIDSLTSLVAKGFRTGFQPSKARIETYIFLQSGVGTFNSNLPIIVVDTNGQPIIEDQILKPYTGCRVVFIDTNKTTGRASITGPEEFSGIGQIRLRGESTYGINKGHYALEIQDEYGQDNDVSLLGMPAESDWILSFDIVDTTLLKNEVAFKWFGDMGHYSPRQRYVEVYFNSDGGAISTSDFKGIYVLREKIKGSKNRVDIGRMDALHNAEPQVTGGYIIKCDKADFGVTYFKPYMEIANYGINYDGNGQPILVEPGPDEVTQSQIIWIADYINEFHSVLWQNTSSVYYPGPQAKYTDYVDVISWIDRGFVEEICYDSDAFSASQFAYKDRNGKIYCGPAWDFDRSFARPYNEWISNGSMFGRWYQKMEEKLEHKITFADRWFQHRKTALNTDLTLAHIDQTVLLMTEAMSRPHAKPSSDFSTWTANVDLLKTWTVNRLNWLDGYIASTFAKKPPIFSPVGGYVSQGSSVVISLPSGATGTIYYTVNGQDPRLEGGAISPSAVVYSSPVPLSKSTCVKARIKDGSNWSAMNTEVYAVGPVLANLRISELMYHPSDPTQAEINALNPDPVAEDFEFIELKNIGGTALNLNLVHFTDGIDFTFGDYTLAAGGYAVLVKNQAAFAARYGTGLTIAGQYLGSLDNNGEEIVLRDAIEAEIHDFDYKDGWYELTDGPGFSLTMVNPASTDPNLWDEKVGWRSSLAAGGTPGGVDTVLAAGSIVINELRAHSHQTDPDWVELYNTTGQNINISGWFLSDRNNDDPNIMKYEIPAGTVINSHSYAVFVENVTFGNPSAPGCHTPFGLSEAGETAYLYSGQSGQVTGYYQTEENFDASETDMTFGRYEKAQLSSGYDFVRQSSPSQGYVNNGPLIAAVVITEINYNPSSGGAYEFVELYNRSGSDVTLMSEASTETSPGHFITENIPWRLEGTGFEFPADTTIPAGGRIIVAKTPALYGGPSSTVLGPYDGALDNGGEELEIQIPGDQEYGQARYWIPIEKVDYDDVAPWPTSADGGGNSLQRLNVNTYGRDYSNWQAATPTPGS